MKRLSLLAILLTSFFLQACGGGGGSSSTPPAKSSVAQSSSLAPSSAAVSSSAAFSSSSVALSSSTSSTSSSAASSSSSAVNVNFAKGADVSWITEMEASGKRFYTKAGVEKDLLDILKEQGMDSIRLRVWVNPTNGYNNIDDVLAKALRVKAAGMRLMIDFHYSDTWADPAHQTKPAAWSTYTVDQLVTAVADHTRDSLNKLKTAGVTPEWVQVGNETNNGMLWNEGKLADTGYSDELKNTNMKNYARFVTSGYDAAKEVFPNTLVIVHVSNCFDNNLFKWNIGGLKANGGKFDVIGASAYPTQREDKVNGVNIPWQTTNAECLANLNDMVATHNVPVMIVEVGAPWDHVDGKAILADIIAKTRAVTDNKGLGVLYWEPQSYNWNGYSLGAFDQTGKPTATMDAFSE